MAEPQLATKAPENDALEDIQSTNTPPTAAAPTPQPSLIPGDTPAQTGASLGVRNIEP